MNRRATSVPSATATMILGEDFGGKMSSVRLTWTAWERL